VIRKERPNLQILTCHDEYLLHTMFDVDGALVGYGGLTPEPLIEMIAAGKAKDYAKARAIHDRLLLVTATVYHRGSHMEGTVALKHGLVARGILEHATVRSPLLPLEPGADVEITNALRSAGLVGMSATKGGVPTRVKPYDLKQRPLMDVELTDKTVGYIDKHAKADKPFFIYLPYTLTHQPRLPHPDFAGKTGNGEWADLLTQID
jgi:hypothetical protein